MTAYEWCLECRIFHGDNHAPMFICWDLTNESSEDDGVRIGASSAGDAAESFVDYLDSQGDYECIEGSPMNVAVKKESGEIIEYTVTGKSRPEYTAELAYTEQKQIPSKLASEIISRLKALPREIVVSYLSRIGVDTVKQIPHKDKDKAVAVLEKLEERAGSR